MRHGQAWFWRRCYRSPVATATTGGSSATTSVPPATTVRATATIPSTTTVAPTTTVPVDCGLGMPGTQTISVGEDARSYDLYLPPDLGAGGAIAPAMVLFHGFTSNAAEIAARTELGALAPRLGVVLLVPQGTGEPTSWHIADPSFADTEFSDALLDHLASSPCVDAANLWLAGFSAGSAWSAVYGCSHADRIAGLVLVSGLAPPICPENDSPIVQITHGTADPVVPFDGGDQPVDGSTVTLDSVPDSAAGWAARAGCTAPPAELSLTSEVAAVTEWTGCAADGAVSLHVIGGGGHVWPVGAFNPGCVALRTMLAADPYEPCLSG